MAGTWDTDNNYETFEQDAGARFRYTASPTGDDHLPPQFPPPPPEQSYTAAPAYTAQPGFPYAGAPAPAPETESSHFGVDGGMPQFSWSPQPSTKTNPLARVSGFVTRLPRSTWIASGVAAVLVALSAGVMVDDAQAHAKTDKLSAAVTDAQSLRKKAENEVTDLRAQKDALNDQVQNSSQEASKARQLSTQMSNVTASLKSCLDANDAFMNDFMYALQTGKVSNSLQQEAQRVSTECGRADSMYKDLVSTMNKQGLTQA
jgi:hypothetical protein